MGFIDKIKSMKNAVTGGTAKVYLDCERISYTAPFQVIVRAQVGDAPLTINRVYLKIEGSEEIEVPDVDVIYNEEGDSQRRVETVHALNETVNLETTIANSQELEANSSYEWIADVELPSNAPSIYKGKFCQHIYKAYAGLDTFGNDPDSGWIELNE